MGSSKDLAYGIPQLTGTGKDYGNWAFRVKLFLEAKEVADALYEDDIPEEDDEDYEKFMKMDRKARCLLVGFISDECLGIVREKESASAMWKALEETFARKCVQSQTLLRKQLNRLRMKEGTSMRSHFQAFDDLVRQLKSAGAKLEENDLVSKLLLSLPESFDPLVTALENICEKDLTLELVKQRLIGEESKRADRVDESSDGEGSSSAFVGKRGSIRKFAGRCHSCSKKGHMMEDCLQEDSSEDESDEEGESHVAVGGKAVSFMASSSKSASCELGRLVFKLDSGSSEHLVNDESVFSYSSKLRKPVTIDVAKVGHSLEATVEGAIDCYSKMGKLLNMRSVLFVPDVGDNVLSIHRLVKHGIDVRFKGDVVFLEKNGEVIDTAVLNGDNYEMEVQLKNAVTTPHEQEGEKAVSDPFVADETVLPGDQREHGRIDKVFCAQVVKVGGHVQDTKHESNERTSFCRRILKTRLSTFEGRKDELKLGGSGNPISRTAGIVRVLYRRWLEIDEMFPIVRVRLKSNPETSVFKN